MRFMGNRSLSVDSLSLPIIAGMIACTVASAVVMLMHPDIAFLRMRFYPVAKQGTSLDFGPLCFREERIGSLRMSESVTLCPP